MDMMRAFEFGSWFIDLVYRVLANNWFSVLINRDQVGYLDLIAELDKEKPFIIAVEILNRGM